LNNEKPNTVCLTFDFDALSVWLGGYPHVTPAMLSQGEFGASVGVPRILDLLKRYNILSTFFVPGHTADSFPKVVQSIIDEGHEIGHHGYGHEDPSEQTVDEERESLDRGFEALVKSTGSCPRGYRSPSWDYSESTLSLLVEYGFTYDSSLFAGDFYPYHPRLNDIVTKDIPLKCGESVPLWEFPVDFSLDDWPHFITTFEPYQTGLSAPSKVYEIWIEEYNYMCTHAPGGVLTLTMHPQVIGRGHRIKMLERLIEKIVTSEAAVFARLTDVIRKLEGKDK
jgi:peptidoglycan-N-acetylglucosamine deacetylase